MKVEVEHSFLQFSFPFLDFVFWSENDLNRYYFFITILANVYSYVKLKID